MSNPGISEEQAAILDRMLSPEFYLSPLKFALWAYPWGQGDLKHHKGPRRWQREIMLSMEEYLRDCLAQKKIFDKWPDFYRHAVSSGRGPGKSALVGMLAHWFASTRIGGSVWVAANGEPQLRTKTFPEIGKWVARGINSEFFEITATAIQPSRWFKEYIESPRGLNKNTRYYYISGQLWSEENPDAFAGAHNYDGEFSIFDEASGIPSPIWTVQEGVFTEDIPDRFWLAFSNPRVPSGAFYECFHKKRELWRTTKIDSRTVEGIALQTYQNIIDQYGEDSDEARVEVYGEFPSVGDAQFIGAKLVDEAVQRVVADDKDAPVVLGVDVARFGSDNTALVVRKGRKILEMTRRRGLDTMQVVGEVIAMIDKHSPDLTAIDEGGLGAGVVDRLKEQRYKVRGVNFGSVSDNKKSWGNKRAEMWGGMRDWLRTGKIPNDRSLMDDLTGPRYKHNSTGAIMLEKKEEMRNRGAASPDCGDALALTFAFPVAWVKGGNKIKYPKIGGVF